MSPWLLAARLVVALAAGFAAGWIVFARSGVRSPNVWVSTAILLAGAVGGPAVCMRLLGPTAWSFTAALALAGFCAGATFWPMSKPQGTREWL